MKKDLNSLYKIFVYFLLFPILELVFIKYISMEQFAADFTYLIAGFLSFCFLLEALSKKSNLNYKPNRKLMLVNLISLLFYSGAIFITYNHVCLIKLTLIRLIVLLLLYIVIFSSLLCFLDLNISKEDKFKLYLFIPLSFSLIAYPTFNSLLWEFLSSSTCKASWFILKVLGFKDISLIGDYTLASSIFKIAIRSKCSGLEGILIFVAVFSIFLIIFSEIKLKSNLVFWSYFTGIIYMYILNILRITAYFSFGFYVSEKYHSAEAGKAIVGLFHSNIGWVLYLLGISFFILMWKNLAFKSLQKTNF